VGTDSQERQAPPSLTDRLVQRTGNRDNKKPSKTLIRVDAKRSIQQPSKKSDNTKNTVKSHASEHAQARGKMNKQVKVCRPEIMCMRETSQCSLLRFSKLNKKGSS